MEPRHQVELCVAADACAPSRPHVVVLMSTYNGERFLDAQLDSLAAQEGVELILHVRDDGSTDRTLEILARHGTRWPNLRKLSTGANLGPAMSFLKLLRTAPPDADYYAFCDQDDVWLPLKLARAVATIEADAGPALYCSNVTCVAEDLSVIGVPRENGDPRFQHILFENIVYGCTAVLNRAARELIVSRIPERGVIMHDWWCALVGAAFGRIHFDPEPGLILYRQHGGNTIGGQASELLYALEQAARLLRNPTRYYRIHSQASEFLRLFGDELPQTHRRSVENLVRSRATLKTRARYAISRDIVRRNLIGSIAARGLVLTGWY
jgi:glycosyltransferase involved in cell wall biosynthesis